MSTTSRQDRVKFSGQRRTAPQARTVKIPSRDSGTIAPVGETLAGKRRRLAQEREAAQLEAYRRAHRDGVNALGHDAAEQQRQGLAVLQSAFALALEAAPTWGRMHGGETPRAFVLAASGGGIAGHYALQLLGYLEPRPYALREVLQLLTDGIERAGGQAPRMPVSVRLRPRRKTGPKVAATPPSPEEVERRRALYAAALAVRPLEMLAQAAGNWCVHPDEDREQKLLIIKALEKAPLLALLAAADWTPVSALVG